MSVAACSKLFEKAGLVVKYANGWGSRGARDDIGNVIPLNPTATIVHYTWGRPTSDYDTVINGRPNLSGPLCNWYVAPDGVISVIAAYKANHAGVGIIPGSKCYGIEVSWIDEGWKPNLSGLDARPWPKAQRAAVIAMCALINKFHSWNTNKTYGHKETARPIGRKFDPALDMSAFRHDVSNWGGIAAADLEGLDFLAELFKDQNEYIAATRLAHQQAINRQLTAKGQEGSGETASAVLAELRSLRDELESLPERIAAALNPTG